MTIAERAIEIARTYLGKVEEAPNEATWLGELMERAGNPCKWKSPQPYCISAVAACYAIAYHEAGQSFPPPLETPGTQNFFAKANEHGWTDREPHVGAIVIFRLAQTWHGHAELVIGAGPEGVDTIGFNTSGAASGDQRNGEGVFIKRRNFKAFEKNASGLWIRGYVNMPYSADEIVNTLLLSDGRDQATDPTNIVTLV